MTDEKIIELYIKDSDKAVTETIRKHGSYCQEIALGILGNSEDAAECVNQACAYIKKNIGEKKPKNLKAFLAKTSRFLALKKAAKLRNKKYQMLTNELSACLSENASYFSADEAKIPDTFMNEFIGQLTKPERIAFIRRYWHFSGVKQTAELFSTDENAVRISLTGALNKLKLFIGKLPTSQITADMILVSTGKISDRYIKEAEAREEKSVKKPTPKKTTPKIPLIAVGVILVILCCTMLFRQISFAVKAAPPGNNSYAEITLFTSPDKETEDSATSDHTPIELILDSDRIYTQIKQEDYALYGIDGKALSSDNFGEKLGKISKIRKSSKAKDSPCSTDSAIKNCKAYYYAGTDSEAVVIVKGNDCCSVFVFSDFVSEGHSLNEKFLIFSAGSSQDISSLKYEATKSDSSSVQVVSSGETFYKNYINSFYNIASTLQPYENESDSQDEPDWLAQARSEYKNPVDVKITVKLKNGLFFVVDYYPNLADGYFEGHLPLTSADNDILRKVFVLNPVDIGAPNIGLFDADDMAAVYTKNQDKKIAPASLTKIITACVALKYASPDEVFTVGSELNLVMPNSSLCYIKQGQRLSLYDLLTGMMVKSGNDAAYTIAVNIARKAAGDKSMTNKAAAEYFCKLMNDFAKEVGAKNSHFVNPDGWDADNHYTTVNDLALFCSYAIRHDELCEIVKIHKKTVVFESGESILWTNTNLLLNKDSSYYMPEAIGLKTGTTPDAGNCLIALAQFGSQRYIAIVTGCETNEGRYKATHQLLELI